MGLIYWNGVPTTRSGAEQLDRMLRRELEHRQARKRFEEASVDLFVTICVALRLPDVLRWLSRRVHRGR